MMNDGFEPVVACALNDVGCGGPPSEGVVVGDNAVLMNLVHAALEVCGIGVAAARNIFIHVEGLDSLEAFGALSGDSERHRDGKEDGVAYHKATQVESSLVQCRLRRFRPLSSGSRTMRNARWILTPQCGMPANLVRP
jgi:hypothetical protein